MTSRGVGWLIALVACHRPANPRDRVLGAISADSELVIAADSTVLAQPRARQVLDVMRPRWPASLGCVVDAALAADQIALGVGRLGDTTIAVSSHAGVHCPALSKLGPDLWVATIGAGQTATTGSVLDDPRFRRARTYLLGAPIALTTTIDGARLLATAQADPLDAWLAIDAGAHAMATEVVVRGIVARLAADSRTAPFAAKITVARTDSQIVARLTEPVAADLAAAVGSVLASSDARAAQPASFACPAHDSPLVASCEHGTDFIVWSLRRVLVSVSDAPSTPVVVNGAVAGMRLGAQIEQLDLKAADVIVAVDSQLVKTHAELVEALGRARHPAAIGLTIRRGTTEALVRLVER